MTKNKYDVLIVGAGLCGCILANLLRDAGKTVLLIERDKHIGGACYSQMQSGIEVHKYGPHIYRTNDVNNWDYFNKYGNLHPFKNEPIAIHNNQVYNLPFNMNTFHQIWNDVITPTDAKRKIQEERNQANIQNPEENLETKAISLVGRTIYETLIKNYTEKQWGQKCTDLPASIISVLPVRFTYDNNYFSEKYQGIPSIGYTKMLQNMITGIDLELNYNVQDINDTIFSYAKTVIYTGRLDTLFNYKFGALPYRGAVFEEDVYAVDNQQGVAVMNFPDEHVDYLRRTEHKHFMESCTSDVTILSREYSIDATYDTEHSYYPIINKQNYKLQMKYHNELPDNMFTCGVNGDYAAYTMDGVLNACKRLLKKLKTKIELANDLLVEE